jgi:hypothetical protein
MSENTVRPVDGVRRRRASFRGTGVLRGRRVRAGLMFVVVLMVVSGVSGCARADNWPAVQKVATVQQPVVDQELQIYRDSHFEAADYFVDYSFDGSYLNFEKKKIIRANDTVAFDANGVPQIRLHGLLYYHPVTVAQFALAEYGKYLTDHDQKSRTLFLNAARVLLSVQSADGALRYKFSFRYYLSNQVYDPGWVSAMAQGQAMSVFARAYIVTADPIYLDAGTRALGFLSIPMAEGGVRSNLATLDPSLSAYVFFEEFASSPDGYTLNGFMFTMLGIYDWCALGHKENLADHLECARDFTSAIRTLTKILPYYDLGTFSAYDLGQYTYQKPAPHVSAHYHMVHIYLLHTLHELTDEPILKNFEERWSADVQ